MEPRRGGAAGGSGREGGLSGGGEGGSGGLGLGLVLGLVWVLWGRLEGECLVVSALSVNVRLRLFRRFSFRNRFRGDRAGRGIFGFVLGFLHALENRSAAQPGQQQGSPLLWSRTLTQLMYVYNTGDPIQGTQGRHDCVHQYPFGQVAGSGSYPGGWGAGGGRVGLAPDGWTLVVRAGGDGAIGRRTQSSLPLQQLQDGLDV